MKKTLSIFLSLIMLLSCFAAPVETYAASKPKATSITKVTAQAAAFKVTWKKGSGITGYQIQYSTSGKFAKKSTKTLKVNKAKTTSKTISKLAGQKKYYVRVRTYKTKGKKTTYSSWSKAKSVTTKLQGASVKKLTAQKAAFKAEWSKVSGVTGYQIQYSTSGKFEKNNTKTVKISKNSTTSKTISKLKTNKKYYVRLRTYKTANKKTYYSSWSKSKAVTTLKNNAASGNTNQATLAAPVIYLRLGGQDGTIEASLKSATLDNFQVEYGKKASNSYRIAPIGGKFIRIEYAILDSGLTPSEFAAYAAIKSRCNHRRRSFPSLRQIANMAHICLDTVIKAIKSLCTMGFIVCTRFVRKCGCFGHNNYIVFDAAVPQEITTVQTSKRTTLTDKLRAAASGLAASVFLFKQGYSKFWGTLLEPLKNYVRKKKKSYLLKENILT